MVFHWKDDSTAKAPWSARLMRNRASMSQCVKTLKGRGQDIRSVRTAGGAACGHEEWAELRGVVSLRGIGRFWGGTGTLLAHRRAAGRPGRGGERRG